ncbi:hypothetical protein D9V30_08410 [Mycetocola reblochoni]|uniref:Minor tail protein n=2 Tax=Mycetocola reblochoni TaxID=331618 RepID=A0A1R4JQE5_9MICO|nr:hypothetical protein [Mycetocola reblochoni]RLP69319.1 hypothetical protein D9V30_08410 [Mycetocola reblochoni]SJN34219.1 hypothetical protein FM119_08840 [Mycetocola reblochoni REB411]
MTITAYPKAGQLVTEEQWSRYFETITDNGPANGFTVTANASGMTVQVAAGLAYVRGHACISDATETLAIAAAPSTGNKRIDTVVLRLNRALSPIVQLAVKTGVATTGTPVAPALVQELNGIWEVRLRDVNVASGQTNVGSTHLGPANPIMGGINELAFANRLSNAGAATTAGFKKMMDAYRASLRTTFSLPSSAAVSGWSVEGTLYADMGIVQAAFWITRTGAAISVPSHGNIVNEDMFNIPDGWRPWRAAAMSTIGTGPVTTGAIYPGGRGLLTAVAGGSTIPRGWEVSLGSTYIRA